MNNLLHLALISPAAALRIVSFFFKYFKMYFCNNILPKLVDTSFDMESPLTDEDIDEDGDFKNVKVRRKRR